MIWYPDGRVFTKWRLMPGKRVFIRWRTQVLSRCFDGTTSFDELARTVDLTALV